MKVVSLQDTMSFSPPSAGMTRKFAGSSSERQAPSTMLWGWGEGRDGLGTLYGNPWKDISPATPPLTPNPAESFYLLPPSQLMAPPGMCF